MREYNRKDHFWKVPEKQHHGSPLELLKLQRAYTSPRDLVDVEIAIQYRYCDTIQILRYSTARS